MPFQRPELATLISRAQADIESRLPGADARLRRTLLGVLARIHAGSVHALYGYLDWLAKQLMVDTAEVEHLERWASIWGVARKAAAQASGDVTFTGTDGVTIPAATVLARADGVEYATDADVTIAGGTATAAVTAAEGGADGNADAASSLSLVSPIAGVNSAATVAAGGLTGGTDTEADEDLRTRVLRRIQQPPHGGADFDYVAWALEVAGVTRAWVYPAELGLGTVTVRFMMDDTYADGIPQAADVTAVQDYIDALRPVTAALTVVAPVAVALDLTIALEPNTATVQAAVQAELEDLLQREAEPGATILLSHLREAISIAAGETDHDLVSPAADVTHSTGEIPVLGTITWQAL